MKLGGGKFSYAEAADAFGSENTSHSRAAKVRYTWGESIFAITLPVTSRRAVTMSSLWKQNPVSSVATTVPGKARLKSETFRMTCLFTSLALNEGEAGRDIVPL